MAAKNTIKLMCKMKVVWKLYNCIKIIQILWQKVVICHPFLVIPVVIKCYAGINVITNCE